MILGKLYRAAGTRVSYSSGWASPYSKRNTACANWNTRYAMRALYRSPSILSGNGLLNILFTHFNLIHLDSSRLKSNTEYYNKLLLNLIFEVAHITNILVYPFDQDFKY
jgi:hypothetical protein